MPLWHCHTKINTKKLVVLNTCLHLNLVHVPVPNLLILNPDLAPTLVFVFVPIRLEVAKKKKKKGKILLFVIAQGL